MASVDLYYFSGTGNTLYIAAQLKERIPGMRLIPVVSLLNVDGCLYPESKTVGFCFPNHAGHLPIPMKQFLKKLHLEGDEYLFAICNSAYSKSLAFKDIDRIVRNRGCRLSAHYNLIMPDNHAMVTKGYRVPGKEEFKRCEQKVQEKLAHIRETILNKGIHHEKDGRPAPFPPWIDKALRPLIFHLVEKHPSKVLKGALYADSKCNGCATCEKICPADRIGIIEGRPVFDYNKTCYGCYACVNFCPVESIQVGSKWYNGRSHTADNGRYPHPYASADDIAGQKRRRLK
ncbi:MAG: EFR1 family ferrodoxin [Bacillota bacterium]